MGLAFHVKVKADAQVQDFSGKDTRNISIVAKKWVRISQFEANSKKGKKVMDKLKTDFDDKGFGTLFIERQLYCARKKR